MRMSADTTCGKGNLNMIFSVLIHVHWPHIVPTIVSIYINVTHSGGEGSKLDEAFEVIAELQNLLKGAQNTAGQLQHPAVPGSAPLVWKENASDSRSKEQSSNRRDLHEANLLCRSIDIRKLFIPRSPERTGTYPIYMLYV